MVADADRAWADSMPDAYERWLVPTVFHPFALDLARQASSRCPRRMLELAAGTGVLTRELVRIGGDVVATDLNASMAMIGRQFVPEAAWAEADALDLPFDGGRFDLVVCQFGVMFFPDKRAAFAEARRVLAPGGRLLFSAWAKLEAHAFQAALVDALARVFPADPPTFMTAVPHGYADLDVVVDDVRAAGFDAVTVRTVTLEGHARSAADIAAGYCSGTPLRAAIESRTDLRSATEAIAEQMEATLGTGTVTGRMTARVVETTSPTGTHPVK
jgi:SAM-dependent methyltransferase